MADSLSILRRLREEHGNDAITQITDDAGNPKRLADVTTSDIDNILAGIDTDTIETNVKSQYVVERMDEQTTPHTINGVDFTQHPNEFIRNMYNNALNAGSIPVVLKKNGIPILVQPTWKGEIITDTNLSTVSDDIINTYAQQEIDEQIYREVEKQVIA